MAKASSALQGATVAFDLDGTLVDTAPDLIGVLNVMLAEHGLPPVPLEASRHLVGGGARYLLEHGFREAGASFDASKAPLMVDHFVSLYLDRIAQESRPFPGVEAVLDEFKARGAKLVVCTNKRTGLSLALLGALKLIDRFDVIAGPDSVSVRKPDAAHLNEAIRMAGGDPARALMVGDSDTDFNTARNAGVPIVLVSFGYSEIAIDTLDADALIDSFTELPEIVDRLFG
jgi:phosphoglycolate phosphatase